MNSNRIKFFTANKFISKKILYGFFTRNGGCSTKPFDSLNCSSNTNDINNIVKENIYFAKKSLGLEKTTTKFFNQVHGTNVEIIDKYNTKKKLIADGGITQKKNISLAILTADCAPIFLINSKHDTICAIHSGWKGSLNNIILETLIKLKQTYKSISDTSAIIGPCLNLKNFEVDRSLKEKFINKKEKYKNFFKKNPFSHKTYFDMRGLLEYQLREASIDSIYHVNNDTYSEESLFFSHRRESHRKALPTGRMINIIGFRQ